MNYLGYSGLNPNEYNEEAYTAYYHNIDSKLSLFPLQLAPVIYNYFEDLSILPFGSLNFNIVQDKNNNTLHLQIPYCVELNQCSIGEFLLFNLSLSCHTQMNIKKYSQDNSDFTLISLDTLQDCLVDPKKFTMRNIAWDYDNQKIELYMYFKVKGNPIELCLVFEEKDILSAQLRMPNYTDEEYISLEQSGEDGVTGENRIAKILTIFRSKFDTKSYFLM